MSLLDAEVVVFSPLPPRRSGIAAYTAELVGELGRHRRVVVVVETPGEVRDLPGALVVNQARYLGAGWLRALPHVYQLGNNQDHGFVLRACLRLPGLVVLHDPVLHHLWESLTLRAGDSAGYEAVLGQCHGAAGRRVARLHALGIFSDAMRYRLPLLRPVLDSARGVLVHSHYAAGRVRAAGGAVPVRVVPHHVSPLVPAFDGLSQAAAQAALGLPQDIPVLLALGHITPAKQVRAVLRALAVLRGQGVAFRFVLGGELGAEMAESLPALVAELGLGDVVSVTGWLSETAFFTHARAADLLMNLRFPVGGESSGPLVRALGMGLPALVRDFGPAAEWPDAAVYKLGWAPDLVPALAGMLGPLLADRAALAAKGRVARAVARAGASLAGSAAHYLAAIADWG